MEQQLISGYASLRRPLADGRTDVDNAMSDLSIMMWFNK
jgi:hypothetical protein